MFNLAANSTRGLGACAMGAAKMESWLEKGGWNWFRPISLPNRIREGTVASRSTPHARQTNQNPQYLLVTNFNHQLFCTTHLLLKDNLSVNSVSWLSSSQLIEHISSITPRFVATLWIVMSSFVWTWDLPASVGSHWILFWIYNALDQPVNGKFWHANSFFKVAKWIRRTCGSTWLYLFSVEFIQPLLTAETSDRGEVLLVHSCVLFSHGKLQEALGIGRMALMAFCNDRQLENHNLAHSSSSTSHILKSYINRQVPPSHLFHPISEKPCQSRNGGTSRYPSRVFVFIFEVNVILGVDKLIKGLTRFAVFTVWNASNVAAILRIF